MHLRIGSCGQDCDGRNQEDRSKSAHLPHLEVCASSQGLGLYERRFLWPLWGHTQTNSLPRRLCSIATASPSTSDVTPTAHSTHTMRQKLSCSQRLIR